MYDERWQSLSDDASRQNYVNFMIKPMTRAKMASASVTAMPMNIVVWILPLIVRRWSALAKENVAAGIHDRAFGLGAAEIDSDA